jgi:ferritin
MKDQIERLLAMLITSPDTETFNFVVHQIEELINESRNS